MVAEVDVIAAAVKADIAGGGGARVANVKFVDVVVAPDELVETAA